MKFAWLVGTIFDVILLFFEKFGNDPGHQFVFEEDGEDSGDRGKESDDKEGY